MWQGGSEKLLWRSENGRRRKGKSHNVKKAGGANARPREKGRASEEVAEALCGWDIKRRGRRVGERAGERTEGRSEWSCRTCKKLALYHSHGGGLICFARFVSLGSARVQVTRRAFWKDPTGCGKKMDCCRPTSHGRPVRRLSM